MRKRAAYAWRVTVLFCCVRGSYLVMSYAFLFCWSSSLLNNVHCMNCIEHLRVPSFVVVNVTTYLLLRTFATCYRCFFFSASSASRSCLSSWNATMT
jgi:hypothetical protein